MKNSVRINKLSRKINKKQKSSEIIKLITLAIVLASITCQEGPIFMNTFTASTRIKRIENNDNNCSLFFTTVSNESMIRVLPYCDTTNMYSRSVVPIETSINSSFPSKVLFKIKDFCIIEGLKFFVIGSA
jgi:hypothetical protein